MRKFKISCKDSLTGMEILADNVSYNMSCIFLSSIGFDFNDAQIKIDYRMNRTLIYHVDENKNIIGRVFCFDENRGLLLGD